MINKRVYIKCLVLLFFTITGIKIIAQDVYDTVVAQDDYSEYYEETSEFEKINRFELTEIEQRTVPDSVVKRFKSDDVFWYADYEPPKKKQQPGKSLQKADDDKSWIRSLTWIIIIGSFIAVIVWFLLSSNVKLFRRETKAIQSDGSADIIENIFDINYKEEIAKAKSNGNYRLAIRLWYLQLLKQMSDRKIIQYKQEKTNSDYLVNLFGTAYYKDFFRLTRSFEYAWYGQFNVSAEAYEGIENDFKNFNQSLP